MIIGRVPWLAVALPLLAGCSKLVDTVKGEKASTAPAPVASASPSAPKATATTPPPPSAAKGDPCTWLTADDFKAAGLSMGRAKRENGIAGPGCTWDPVLGAGGFLHVEVMSLDAYAKRKERDTATLVMLAGIGDEAFIAKATAGHAALVKKGDRAARIDGNASLDRGKLEPLANAISDDL